jgi:hypothetical protein
MKKFIKIGNNLINKETIVSVLCLDYYEDGIYSSIFKDRIVVNYNNPNDLKTASLYFDSKEERNVMFEQIEKELAEIQINKEKQTESFHKDQIVRYENSDWRLIAKSNFTKEYGGMAVRPDITHWVTEEVYNGKRLHIPEDLLEPLHVYRQESSTDDMV